MRRSRRTRAGAASAARSTRGATQIVALSKERNEVEPAHPGRGLHRETGVGASFENVQGDVGFAAGRGIEHLHRLRPEPRLGEQVAKQQVASGFGLARDEADPGEVRGARQAPRVAGRHHQTLDTPCPLDHHQGLARELLADERQVEVPRLRIEYVHSRRERLAVRHPDEPVEAAAEKRRNLRARLADRPFEQRIVAPREHRGRRRETGRAAGEFDPAPHPRLDEVPREQHLPRDPAHGDRLRRHELVDLALLDPEEIGDLPGGEERVHGDCPEPAPRNVMRQPGRWRMGMDAGETRTGGMAIGRS